MKLQDSQILFNTVEYSAVGVADHDRAIHLDANNAAAYLGRCEAKSELGRHEEAIEDYDELMRLDPDAASAFEKR